MAKFKVTVYKPPVELPVEIDPTQAEIYRGEPGPPGESITGPPGPSIVGRGAWTALNTYVKLDAVTYNNASWMALDTSAGIEPAEGPYWQLLAGPGTVEFATLEEVINAVPNKAVAPQELAQVLSYTYSQASPSSLWVIEHNLNRRVKVTIYDSAGTEVEGEVVAVTNNSVSVSFSSAFSGSAYLS